LSFFYTPIDEGLAVARWPGLDVFQNVRILPLLFRKNLFNLVLDDGSKGLDNLL